MIEHKNLSDAVAKLCDEMATALTRQLKSILYGLVANHQQQQKEIQYAIRQADNKWLVVNAYLKTYGNIPGGYRDQYIIRVWIFAQMVRIWCTDFGVNSVVWIVRRLEMVTANLLIFVYANAVAIVDTKAYIIILAKK